MTVSGFPGTPKTLRGGLVRIDPNARSLLDVVIFQYNPDTLTRTLQPRAIGGEPGDRLEVLRSPGRRTRRSSSMPRSTPPISSSTRPTAPTSRSSPRDCCRRWRSSSGW